MQLLPYTYLPYLCNRQPWKTQVISTSNLSLIWCRGDNLTSHPSYFTILTIFNSHVNDIAFFFLCPHRRVSVRIFKTSCLPCPLDPRIEAPSLVYYPPVPPPAQRLQYADTYSVWPSLVLTYLACSSLRIYSGRASIGVGSAYTHFSITLTKLVSLCAQMAFPIVLT